MKTNLERKMYLGIGRFMIPIPQLISARGLEKGAKEPITAELVSEELGIEVNRVEEIIDKLEGLKTFLYRSDGKGINWAYPLSLDNTGHEITASTGERFFAA
jgi:hypothetical protein